MSKWFGSIRAYKSCEPAFSGRAMPTTEEMLCSPCVFEQQPLDRHMQSESGRAPRYIVRISRHGAEDFGWAIYREGDAVEVCRSTGLFRTRIEALLDSARAAATMNIAVIEPPIEGESFCGCE